MSELSKRIGRVQRREAPGGMGFGAVRREAPRAMLAAVLVPDTAAANAAIAAGADAVIVTGSDAAGAAAQIAPLERTCAGALLAAFDEAGARVLHEAGCDFVISAIEATAAVAVDPEAMGHVIAPDAAITDTALRALQPLGLDAIFVEFGAAAISLADQIELVRLASLSGTPLAVTVAPGVSSGELRVLRDAGAAVAVLPAGATDAQVGELIEALKAVPAPRRARAEGAPLAIVPPVRQQDDHDHEEDDN